MAKNVVLTFDEEWVMSEIDGDFEPVEAVLEFIREAFEDVEVNEETYTICDIIINDDLGETEILENIYEILKENFGVTNPDDIVSIFISEPNAIEEITEEEFGNLLKNLKLEMIEDISDLETNDYQAVMDKIEALVGAEEFKKLANEIVSVAPSLIKYNTVETFTHQSYVFSINDGNGLTTYLELFAELLAELKLFNFRDKYRVVEVKLPVQNQNDEMEKLFIDAINNIRYHSIAGGAIVCIDISEWMTKISDKYFRELLSEVENNLGNNIIVFRVPFVENKVLKGIRSEISDILFVREVSFVPFSNTELTECAKTAISGFGFTMADDAWDILNTRITEEKNDGRFYGINTVNKIVKELIYRKQRYNALNNIDDTVIKRDEILDFAETFLENSKSGMEMLDSYVGMENIKAKVEEIVAQIEMCSKNKDLGYPCIHMRFVGNPGTGKTTVARVIGKILKEKGILRNGSFFEHSGRDLCGTYIGQTAPKTAGICRDAYGSVLFIDEAYSLYRDAEYNTKDYGREAIDTLIAEMENHRSDLVIIMAGYPDEMETLMKANAGLESRMPYVIEFPNYTREQLSEIFMLMVKKSFSYKDGFEQAVNDYFNSLPDEVLKSKEFSNARFVRNLFERTWGKAVMRAQLDKQDSVELIKEDFLLASAEKEFGKVMQKPIRKSLGFI